MGDPLTEFDPLLGAIAAGVVLAKEIQDARVTVRIVVTEDEPRTEDRRRRRRGKARPGGPADNRERGGQS